MSTFLTVLVVLAVVVLLVLALSVRIVKQYEQGVLFRFGRVVGVRQPGLQLIVPLAEVLHRVSMRIEIGVDKNTTVVFPSPLMSTIGELGAFLARETAAGAALPAPPDPRSPQPVRPAAGTSKSHNAVTNGQVDVRA